MTNKRKQGKKLVILATTTALTASLFLPSLASANTLNKTLPKTPIEITVPADDTSLPISLHEQAEIDKDIQRADDIFKKTTTVLPDGTYVFDEKKAKALGLSASEIAVASSYFKDISSKKFATTDKVGETEEGKIKITINVLLTILKKNKSTIDKGIQKVINAVPFVKTATKNQWKKQITATKIINQLEKQKVIEKNVEDFLVNKVILKIVPKLPEWIARGLAKFIIAFV